MGTENPSIPLPETKRMDSTLFAIGLTPFESEKPSSSSRTKRKSNDFSSSITSRISEIKDTLRDISEVVCGVTKEIADKVRTVISGNTNVSPPNGDTFYL